MTGLRRLLKVSRSLAEVWAATVSLTKPRRKKLSVIISLHILLCILSALQAVVEKVLKVLTVDQKDIRKADWNNKEVGVMAPFFLLFDTMKKSAMLDNPAH